MTRQPQIEMPYLFDIGRGHDNPWQVGDRFRRPRGKSGLYTLELCAGGGGQALGIESAGIEHAALVEYDAQCCETLSLNRPKWNVIRGDLREFDAAPYVGVDIVSGGLPCPPFSVAGKQLGDKDERNLFPTMIRIVDQVRPKAVMIENVRGMLDAVFIDYRKYVSEQLRKLGYQTGWSLMSAAQFGVPQLRPRVVFVALRKDYSEHFSWPRDMIKEPPTVGETLYDLMTEKRWKGAKAWRKKANEIAPTIVGGSLKHGGPDLGPTRAKRAWATLAVDGMGIADEAPDRDFIGNPRLTVRMVARLQGFPDTWEFSGKKTRSYRQVGNAFPPPFATAVAACIRNSLTKTGKVVSIAS